MVSPREGGLRKEGSLCPQGGGRRSSESLGGQNNKMVHSGAFAENYALRPTQKKHQKQLQKYQAKMILWWEVTN